MFKKKTSYWFAFSLLLFSNFSLSTDEEIYRIDIILFKFLPDLDSNEIFEEPVLDLGNDLALLSSLQYPEFIEPPALDLQYPFQDFFIDVNSPQVEVEEEIESELVRKPKNRDFFQIDAGEKFSLSEEVDLFKRSRDYRVIGHYSWFQPVSIEESAKPLLIDSEIYKDNKIFGSLKIYKKRFLHTDFNFFLAETTIDSDFQNLTIPLEAETNEGYEVLSEKDSMKVTFQINQSRKLKSGELHYIDHPKFGIIYRIVKTEKIEPS